MLGGKKTPRARPQERARAADAKPNASKPPTQAAGGAPRPRREGAQATRQPVTRTHGRARPAAKPTRPTTERRPAGAGATAPPPRAPETARPRQRTAKRRRGGRRRRRPGGTRAQEQAAHSLPSAQGAPFGRISSAADADGSDEHGAQAGGTTAGRSCPKGAEQTPLPRAQSGARPSGRASRRAQSGRARRRSGRIWPPVRLCGGFFRWWWVAVLLLPKKRPERRKTQKRACLCVCHCDILRAWVYVAHRKECMTWKKRETGLSRRETRA